MSSFFIDLVSNASMNEFPENSLSKFTNVLCQPLNFNREWEVAITEIFYPIDFENTRRKTKIKLELLGDYGMRKRTSREYEIEYQIEMTSAEVCDLLKETIEKDFIDTETGRIPDDITLPSFSVNPKTDKIRFSTGITYNAIDKSYFIYSLEFDDDNFLFALGFDALEFNNEIRKNLKGFSTIVPETVIEIEAQNKMNLNARTNLIFIYTDIIKPHSVGDSSSQLLRVAPLSKGIYEKVGHVTFPNSQYYPLAKNYIESISIILADENGELLKFESGRTFINLNFRPKFI